jgi:hypothetical protein
VEWGHFPNEYKNFKKRIYDVGWLYDLTDKVSDLTFIRFGAKTQARFDKWLTDHGTTKSTLCSIQKYLKTLPTRLQEQGDRIP